MKRPDLAGQLFVTVVACLLAVGAGGLALLQVERLRPLGGLPAHICGQFRDPVAFVQKSRGEYLVLDRREHTVYSIDRARTTATRLLQIGAEDGSVLQPGVLSLGPNDFYAVTDGPAQRERIQVFADDGTRLGGFLRPDLAAPRLTIGPLILNGAGSLQFTGRSFLVNAPETGALISELDLNGGVIRQIGVLRTTGQERDPNVHLALNIGLPLVDPTGGMFFVFQTGVPLFRKYDAGGHLLFERHVEGTELDADIQSLPTTWPARKIGGSTWPLVLPLVRTAAVDPTGRLWVSLIAPMTYVYGATGDKIRTVQFDATGPLSPHSLFFSLVTGHPRVLITPGCYEFDGR